MLPCPAVGATPEPLRRAPGPEKPSGVAAMAVGCLGLSAVCAALGYGAYLNLPPAGSDASLVPQIFAALIGLFGGLGVASVYSLLRGHGRGPESRRLLEARART